MNEYLYDESYMQKHFLKTYLWMFLGVLTTFGVAYLCSNSFNFVYTIYSSPFIYLGLVIAQFGVVIALSARLMKMSSTACTILYFLYAILTGITFSAIFLAYDLGSIAFAFLLAALFFGSLVAIGSTIKKDLSGIGSICLAGLFAMIIYSLVCFIFKLSMNSYLYSIIGLVIFMGITAWDAQKAKRLAMQYCYDEVMMSKLSIYSAFELYLDFINIFLYILRLLGKGRD